MNQPSNSVQTHLTRSNSWWVSWLTGPNTFWHTYMHMTCYMKCYILFFLWLSDILNKSEI